MRMYDYYSKSIELSNKTRTMNLNKNIENLNNQQKIKSKDYEKKKKFLGSK